MAYPVPTKGFNSTAKLCKQLSLFDTLLLLLRELIQPVASTLKHSKILRKPFLIVKNHVNPKFILAMSLSPVPPKLAVQMNTCHQMHTHIQPARYPPTSCEVNWHLIVIWTSI